MRKTMTGRAAGILAASALALTGQLYLGDNNGPQANVKYWERQHFACG